jgi:hypothetical protein
MLIFVSGGAEVCASAAGIGQNVWKYAVVYGSAMSTSCCSQDNDCHDELEPLISIIHLYG